MKIDRKVLFKDTLKFLCGAFFVTAGVNWWMYFNNMSAPFPFMPGTTVSPEFLGLRGCIHFVLFLITLYCGFIKKAKT